MSLKPFSLIGHSSRRHLALCMLTCLAASMSWGCLGSSSSSELGSLELELTAQDRDGHTYRLRNASFEVRDYYAADAGLPEPVVLSSEGSLDASFLTHPLVPGTYRVTLRSGWHLERLDPSGATPVAALLLSEPSRFVSVRRRRTSHVRYDFGLGDDVVAFGGELAISIHIEEPFVGIDAGSGG